MKKQNANQEGLPAQINRSGFPFQLKVEQEVRSNVRNHRWEVASREHPWMNPETHTSGFIDLVLKHIDYSTFRLVVECKRVRADDATQLRWHFLLPDQTSEPVTQASCFEVEGKKAPAPYLFDCVRVWDEVSVTPSSLQAEFCVMKSDETRRQTILESHAADLLESIEGLAEEELNIEKSQRPATHLRLFIFPVIVTNAEIAVCRFDPRLIKIDDGTIDDCDISIVPFIRFRKSLATGFPQGTFFDLESANRARERSIFVVNAARLSEFLSGWKVTPRPGEYQYAVQKLL
jgi:hypothetical protein